MGKISVRGYLTFGVALAFAILLLGFGLTPEEYTLSPDMWTFKPSPFDFDQRIEVIEGKVVILVSGDSNLKAILNGFELETTEESYINPKPPGRYVLVELRSGDSLWINQGLIEGKSGNAKVEIYQGWFGVILPPLLAIGLGLVAIALERKR